MVNYTINSKKIVLLNEHSTGQISQTFSAALPVLQFANREERIRKAFSIHFYDQNCSIMVVNEICSVQLVLGTMAKTSPLNPFRIPTVFETLIWFHCVNMVSDSETIVCEVQLQFW